MPPKVARALAALLAATTVLALPGVAGTQQVSPAIPATPLAFGAFTARFGGEGSFILEGQGWPSFKGTWKIDGAEVEIVTPGAADGCDAAGRYRFRSEGRRVSFDLVIRCLHRHAA